MQMPAASSPTQPDPTAGGQPDDASDGGYTIEIEVAGDGSMTVSVESAGTEDAESPGGDESADEGNSMPVSSIREACKVAEQIVQAGGKMPGKGGMSVEDAFQNGFKGSDVGSGVPGDSGY